MWILFLLPLPLPLLPLGCCFDYDIKNVQITDDGIVATREYPIVEDGTTWIAEVTDIGEIGRCDEPIRVFILRQHTKELDFDKPFFTKKISEGKNQTMNSYSEVVNSTFADRLILSYLVNQRKHIRRIRYVFKRGRIIGKQLDE